MDPVNVYPIQEGVDLIKSVAFAKFDETVEMSVNLNIKKSHSVRDTVVLPHQFAAEKKVLVVDDEQDVRAIYVDILDSENIAAESVASGIECLNKLEAAAEDFGLVVLDVLLPEQTGYDILDVIRANWPDLPVVLVSGKVHPLTHDALEKLGAAEFLEKPVDPEKLIATVKSHLLA